MSQYRAKATPAQKIILLILILIMVGFGIWILISNYEPDKIEPGIQVNATPIQEKITEDITFQKDEFTIIPLASFEIKGKILSKKRYRLGKESDLSPFDLALGWGKMSDESVLEKIKIWQSGRWYRWKTKKYPIPRREIEKNSANMHIVPANKDIKRKVKGADEWDIIELKGYLIKVIAEDDWIWKSSLTRNDTGDNACELIWVEDFEVVSE
ncbi:MAG TPA: hypothetical protein VKP78_12785 [bacterium]|nr:hypothetical protein [bacterium]